MNNTTHTQTVEKSLAEIGAELNLLGESSLVDELLICESAVRNIKQLLDNIRKRLADPVHLVIQNDGGVLHEVSIFRTSEQAEKHFRTVTGFTYEAVCKWEEADRSYDIGMYRCEEFDTQIWEVEIKGDTR